MAMVEELQDVALENVARLIYDNASFQKSEVRFESGNWRFTPDEELPIMRRTVSDLAIPEPLQKMVCRRIAGLSVNRLFDMYINSLREEPDSPRSGSAVARCERIRANAKFFGDRCKALLMADELEESVIWKKARLHGILIYKASR
ncbi:hypothetical protein NPIL_231751 [Nephila pilipes]|uniref:Uncharacterized protein n=1 Tax=Nephila pilipes TaxID=299642 RepID=A0A8X6MU91_NEPPI|nr:hypothetical protein NPIL_231751 [Nephila pilipes]